MLLDTIRLAIWLINHQVPLSVLMRYCDKNLAEFLIEILNQFGQILKDGASSK